MLHHIRLDELETTDFCAELDGRVGQRDEDPAFVRKALDLDVSARLDDADYVEVVALANIELELAVATQRPFESWRFGRRHVVDIEASG